MLSNKGLKPNFHKIGYTATSVKNRIKTLSSSSSIPFDFKEEFSLRVEDPVLVEKRIHMVLKSFRVSERKEFFDIALRDAKAVCELIANYEYDSVPVPHNYKFSEEWVYSSKVNEKGKALSLQEGIFLRTLMAATTNNTLIDKLFSTDQNFVDGFMDVSTWSELREIKLQSARAYAISFSKVASEFTFRNLRGDGVTRKIFDFCTCYKGQVAWRFTPEFRRLFESIRY